MKYDVAVIGAGPGGYTAAIRAAQLGASVALIENNKAGGTCLHVGCIPTKAMLKSVEAYKDLAKYKHLGIDIGQARIDFAQINHRKYSIVQTLFLGLQHLINKKKVKLIQGTATIEAGNEIKVTGDEEQRIHAKKIILATGASPIEIPAFPFDHVDILDSTDMLRLESIPQSLLILGGGVIALEFATIYAALGTKVTIVEMQNQLLPNEDADVVAPLAKQLKKDGITILLDTAATHYEKKANQLHVHVKASGTDEVIRTEKVLVAVGRKANLSAVRSIADQLAITHGKILVNEKMETAIPGVYAIGDVIGGYQLAHAASHEGTIAAENACGRYQTWEDRAVPRCIYTIPEIASVGLTEKSARERYGDVTVSIFPFQANGKALIDENKDGMIKIIADPQTGEIVGGAVVGIKASEQISQITAAIHMMATTEDLELMIAAHPTISEGVKEAAMGALGQAIHM